MRRGRHAAVLALSGGLMLAFAGCGAEDFPNEPRSASPIELTAKVDGSKVVVSPDKVGAGLATVTIANIGDEETQLTFSGPQDQSTPPIIPGGVANYKLNLEPGNYDVTTDDSSVMSSTLSVGKARPSAQNDLLLP